MPSAAAAPAALDGVPASFVRGYIDNLRRRKRVRAPSAELAAEHALAIRTAFRLELSLPLPDAPAIDSATAEVIARALAILPLFFVAPLSFDFSKTFARTRACLSLTPLWDVPTSEFT